MKPCAALVPAAPTVTQSSTAEVMQKKTNAAHLAISISPEPSSRYFNTQGFRDNGCKRLVHYQQKKSGAYLMIFDDNSKIIFVKSS